MEYSVEDMSKIVGVSVRTLHYYDEISLVKPALRMANGRRYYGIEQLLNLLDVIFFKRIGFSLKKIKPMLIASNADKTALMIAKKQFLQKEIKRMKDLVKLIDETEFYCEGENIDQNEMFKQFEHLQKNTNEYKQLFEKEFGEIEDREKIERIKKMSIEEQKESVEKQLKNIDRNLYKKRTTALTKKIIEAINSNMKEGSKEVQDLMKEYYEIINMWNSISKKQWLSIAIGATQDMDVYIMWAKIHPKMPEFLYNAMRIFADTSL